MNHFLKTYNEIFERLSSKLTVGHAPDYQNSIDELPIILDPVINLKEPVITLSAKGQQTSLIEETLRKLMPWRKGPFNFFGVHIDSEWRSDMKWDRIKNLLPSLDNKRILDIGCSNGYFMFKMLESQPKYILGVDPSVLFYFQFLAVQKYLQSPKLYYLPCGIQDILEFEHCFDVILSMGILYHRKSPLETLEQTRSLLAPNGCLLLEGLYIEGNGSFALCPEHRYAKMNNVHFLPTLECVLTWLKQAGFIRIEMLHTGPTTLEEQRQTRWIKTESLNDFLDPSDPSKTVEGLPAPRRFIARAFQKDVVK